MCDRVLLLKPYPLIIPYLIPRRGRGGGGRGEEREKGSRKRSVGHGRHPYHPQPCLSSSTLYGEKSGEGGEKSREREPPISESRLNSLAASADLEKEGKGPDGNPTNLLVFNYHFKLARDKKKKKKRKRKKRKKQQKSKVLRDLLLFYLFPWHNKKKEKRKKEEENGPLKPLSAAVRGIPCPLCLPGHLPTAPRGGEKGEEKERKKRGIEAAEKTKSPMLIPRLHTSSQYLLREGRGGKRRRGGGGGEPDIFSEGSRFCVFAGC